MKMQILSLAALVSMLVIGCSDGDDAAPMVQVGRNDDSAAVEAIAGDKSRVALVLQRAMARGTFDDALAEALKDSMMAAEVVRIIDADPRFARVAATAGTTTANATTAKRAAASSPRSASSGARTTMAAKGDALDRTEAEAKKINERLEQAARVKREAEQAKRTVDDILGRK
jgi:hypothetical protein